MVALNHLLQPSQLLKLTPNEKSFRPHLDLRLPFPTLHLLDSPGSGSLPFLLEDRFSAFSPVGIHSIPSSMLILSYSMAKNSPMFLGEIFKIQRVVYEGKT